MNGLLDFIKTPEGQGLLSAAFGGLAGARRGQPLNSIGRAGLAGLQGYGSAQDRVTQDAEAAQNRELRGMQVAKYKRDMTADETAAAEKQRIEDLIKTSFTPVTGTSANAATGITGPRPEAAAAIGTKPAVDFQQLIAMGVPFERVKQLAESKNLGRNKVARTAEVDGPDGSKRIALLDDFGSEIGNLAGYTAPVQINQGDRVTFAKPTPGQSFGINETPDGRAGRAVTIRGQNMTDSRARERMAFDVEKAASGASGGTRPRTGPMSVTLQKELLESDDAIQTAGSVVRALQTAKQQNSKAYDGYFAKTRAQITSNLGGSEAADATIDIDNLMTGQGLDQMKSIFGAAPTEGERKILMEMQASVDKTPKQRAAIMDRAIAAAERRAAYAQSKAKAIRDGSYLTDGIQLPESSGGFSGGWEPAGKNSAISSGGWSATLKK